MMWTGKAEVKVYQNIDGRLKCPMHHYRHQNHSCWNSEWKSMTIQEQTASIKAPWEGSLGFRTYKLSVGLLNKEINLSNIFCAGPNQFLCKASSSSFQCQPPYYSCCQLPLCPPCCGSECPPLETRERIVCWKCKSASFVHPKLFCASWLGRECHFLSSACFFPCPSHNTRHLMYIWHPKNILLLLFNF